MEAASSYSRKSRWSADMAPSYGDIAHVPDPSIAENLDSFINVLYMFLGMKGIPIGRIEHAAITGKIFVVAVSP